MEPQYPENHPDFSLHNEQERSLEEHYVAMLHDAIDTLESYHVTPDGETFTAENIRFGRFGEDRLTIEASMHDGVQDTLVRYDSTEKKETVTFCSAPDASHWTNVKTRVEHAAMARFLDAEWPQTLYDNQAARDLTKRGVAFSELRDFLQDKLAPKAATQTRSKSYSYETSKENSLTELRLSYDDEARAGESPLRTALLTLSCTSLKDEQKITESPGLMIEVDVNPLEMVSIKLFVLGKDKTYHEQERVENPEELYTTISGLVDELVAEKRVA